MITTSDLPCDSPAVRIDHLADILSKFLQSPGATLWDEVRRASCTKAGPMQNGLVHDRFLPVAKRQWLDLLTNRCTALPARTSRRTEGRFASGAPDPRESDAIHRPREHRSPHPRAHGLTASSDSRLTDWSRAIGEAAREQGFVACHASVLLTRNRVDVFCEHRHLVIVAPPDVPSTITRRWHQHSLRGVPAPTASFIWVRARTKRRTQARAATRLSRSRGAYSLRANSKGQKRSSAASVPAMQRTVVRSGAGSISGGGKSTNSPRELRR